VRNTETRQSPRRRLTWISAHTSCQHEFVRGDGVVADADGGGVVDGVRDGGGGAGDADLADAAGAERVELGVGDVEAGDVEGADVAVDGDVVVGEVFVDGAAGDGVDERGFVEREADAPDDSALELVDAGLLVHQRADVVGCDDAADVDHAGVAIDGDLGEDGTEGLLRGGGVVLAGLGGALGFDVLGAVAGDERGDVFALRGIFFQEDAADVDVDVTGESVVNGRLRVADGESTGC
jgi:hypothetical protein